MSTPQDFREERIPIDKDRLDLELMQHPQLVYDAMTAHAESLSKRDHAKNQIREAENRAKAKYRGETEKPTEAGATRYASEDADVLKAIKRHEALVKKARDWDAVVEAVRSRGPMLNKLVDWEVAMGAAVVGQSESIDRRNRREKADDEVQEDVQRRRNRRLRRNLSRKQ